jgi:hypothetical protein
MLFGCSPHGKEPIQKNLKQIFPEKELGSHSPNFHIHVPVSDLYIPTIDLPILLQEICGPILGIYKSLTDTWMWKFGLRPRHSQKRNTYMGFPRSAYHRVLHRVLALLANLLGELKRKNLVNCRGECLHSQKTHRAAFYFYSADLGRENDF